MESQRVIKTVIIVNEEVYGPERIVNSDLYVGDSD